MLTIEKIREFTKKYQTNEHNVIREYVQHLCLSALYKHREAGNLLFKGGTALRMIYHSPRFSEDLDFTGRFYHFQDVEKLFLNTLVEVEQSGIMVELKEAKKTSGGFLGIIEYHLYDHTGTIFFEISLRKPKKKSKESEVVTIASEFTIPYTVVQLSTLDLVSEKVQAVTTRAKPRDYYDLYFILRHNFLSKLVDKGMFAVILNQLEGKKIDFRKELQHLLPVSHHRILKNFSETLKKEINSYL